jgi:cob(I)alamin adenosyltransferase
MMATSIATRTGDDGTTSLIGGQRISKADLRVDAYGTVDELIASIGLARGLCAHADVSDLAKSIQRELFAVAEALANAPKSSPALDPSLAERLTEHIHRIERQDGILGDWSIPGEHAGAAAFDVARTVCRRAERAAVRLNRTGGAVHPTVIVYLNRLADLLWLLGRVVERDAGVNSALRRPEDGGGRWSKAWP